MFKVFLIVFMIFGTVVGSGFSSGKEIMVFFSRFGAISYLYIFWAGILFFLLFYMFLSKGKQLMKIYSKPCFNNIIVFISLVFCSSMFAGIKSLFCYFSNWVYWILLFGLIVLCLIVTFKGLKGLEKAICFLMPIASLLFLFVLLFSINKSSSFQLAVNSWAGLLYCPLYVALNTSMSGIVVSKLGQNLTKKQTLFASLFSAVLLVCFLFLGNIVLQKNPESMISEMPFLYIVEGNTFFFSICFFVVLVGCLTTLLSLCFTLKNSFEKFIKNKIYCTLLAVFLPLFVSALGFSEIVSMLYPICSVLGVLILLFSISSLKQTDKVIHSESQNTQNRSRRHY